MEETLQEMCGDCGQAKKVIKAGVSKKTGKSYDSFSVCEGCNPPKGQYASKASNSGSQVLEEVKTLRAEVNTRFTLMGQYLKGEFEKLNK